MVGDTPTRMVFLRGDEGIVGLVRCISGDNSVVMRVWEGGDAALTS